MNPNYPHTNTHVAYDAHGKPSTNINKFSCSNHHNHYSSKLRCAPNNHSLR